MSNSLKIAIISIDEPIYAAGTIKRLIAKFPQDIKFICDVPFQPKKLSYCFNWLLIMSSIYSFRDFCKFGLAKVRKTGSADNLKNISERAGIDFCKMKQFDHALLYKKLKDLNADIVFFNQSHLIKKEILELPRFGCWNKHFGKLPQFRGAFPFIHQFLQGEKAFCYSLYVMGEKLDCGHLMKEGGVQLDFNRPFSENLKSLNEASADAIIFSIDQLKKQGQRPLNPLQDEFIPYKTPTVLQMIKFKFLWKVTKIKEKGEGNVKR